jgi:HEAT repeat protein
VTSFSPLLLSTADRERIGEIDRIPRLDAEGVRRLITMLGDPSWAVRRAVVAALARAGDAAVRPLCEVLRTQRDDEARLAAAVDALSASRGAVEAAVLPLTRDPSDPVICDAAQILGRRRAMDAVPALERLTGHPNDNVAVAAIEALGRMGASCGIAALVKIAGSGNFFRTFPAVEVLGRSGDRRALEPLLHLLDKPLFALEAARALGRLGETAAARPLVRSLRRAGDALARVVSLALVAIHSRAQARFGAGGVVEEALRGTEDPQPLVRNLAESIPRASPEEKAAICTVLSWIGDETATATLLSLIDVAPEAATAAVRALGKESDPKLAAALRDGDSARRLVLLPLIGARTRSAADVLPCLDDPDPAVRVAACDAVARIGDVAAVPRLFELLRDSSLSQAAANAIQSLGSGETERLALAAAAAREPHVRRAALRIIAYFGYRAGLDALVEAARGDDERLRETALHGLPEIDDPRALAVLLEAVTAPSPRTRAAAMRALAEVGGDRVIGTLRKGLHDPDPWVRYYACQALGKRADVASVGEMLAHLRDPAGQVRVAAVEALARIDDRRALSALREAVRSGDLDLRRAALLGLGLRCRPDALPTLIEAATNADVSTRLIVLSALEAYSDAAVVPVLASAAGDADEGVRTAAVGQLGARSSREATAALISLLGNPAVRDRAVEALSSAPEARLSAIASALENAGQETAAALVAALSRMKRPDAFAALIDALAVPNVQARRAAAAALGALRVPEAAAALDRVLAHEPDPEVREICLAGLAT